MNSRPLDPQSSALPTALHPVVHHLNSACIVYHGFPKNASPFSLFFIFLFTSPGSHTKQMSYRLPGDEARRGRSWERLLLWQAVQIVNKLLCGAAREAAVPNLPSVGLCQQLRLVHVDTLAGGQHLDHLLVLPLLGHAVMDRHAKAAGQRQLFLHGIGAVDVTVVFHVCPVIPGLPDQVTEMCIRDRV